MLYNTYLTHSYTSAFSPSYSLPFFQHILIDHYCWPGREIYVRANSIQDVIYELQELMIVHSGL